MMDHHDQFVDLVVKARAGDSRDLQLAVSRFEPQLIRAIRRRRQTQSPQVTAIYDTADCLQSVLAGFYKKVSDPSRQLEITSTGGLNKLLLKMTHDKLIDYDRRTSAAKRPQHSQQLVDIADENAETPSQIASHVEEVRSVSDGLSDAGERILSLYREGHSSERIAEMVDGQSSRSIRRFLKQLRDQVLGKIRGD